MSQPSTKAVRTASITPFQSRVYHLLLQIPAGQVSTYGHLATALDTSPRAVGNALRHNPFAPGVPCHRIVQTSGYIGGFMGECGRAPSGVNQTRKRELLAAEGVVFDRRGMLVSVGNGDLVGSKRRGMFFDGPWDTTGQFEQEKFE